MCCQLIVTRLATCIRLAMCLGCGSGCLARRTLTGSSLANGCESPSQFCLFFFFFGSETVPLMGLRSPGEFKHYAFERFRSILHMPVRNSLKAQCPITDWAAEKIKESWNVQ